MAGSSAMKNGLMMVSALMLVVGCEKANKGSGSIFDISGGDFPLHALTDADGEVYRTRLKSPF